MLTVLYVPALNQIIPWEENAKEGEPVQKPEGFLLHFRHPSPRRVWFLKLFDQAHVEINLHFLPFLQVFPFFSFA